MPVFGFQMNEEDSRYFNDEKINFENGYSDDDDGDNSYMDDANDFNISSSSSDELDTEEENISQNYDDMMGRSVAVSIPAFLNRKRPKSKKSRTKSQKSRTKPSTQSRNRPKESEKK